MTAPTAKKNIYFLNFVLGLLPLSALCSKYEGGGGYLIVLKCLIVPICLKGRRYRKSKAVRLNAPELITLRAWGSIVIDFYTLVIFSLSA